MKASNTEDKRHTQNTCQLWWWTLKEVYTDYVCIYLILYGLCTNDGHTSTSTLI